jgi:hypothetical protein
MKGTKHCTLALILLLATSSLLWIESTSAQSIPKPSTPEFTVKQIDQSYDVAPSTTTNPYTGEPTTTPSYHVSKLSIEVTIKNQPYTPTTVNGNTTGIFYNVEAKSNKPHYAAGFEGYNEYANRASSEDYTVVTVNVDNREGGVWEISRGIQVDIRVQAVVGYSYLVQGIHIFPEGNEFVLLSAGDWSDPQTIVIGEENAIVEPTSVPASSTPTETAAPTSTPSQAVTQTEAAFGLSWEQIVIAVMAVAIAVLAVGMIVLRRRNRLA